MKLPPFEGDRHRRWHLQHLLGRLWRWRNARAAKGLRNEELDCAICYLLEHLRGEVYVDRRIA
jgi:hypothetical protein